MSTQKSKFPNFCTATGKLLAPASIIKVHHNGYWNKEKPVFTSVRMTFFSLIVILGLSSYIFSQISSYGTKSGIMEFSLKTEDFLSGLISDDEKRYLGNPDTTLEDMIPLTKLDLF